MRQRVRVADTFGPDAKSPRLGAEGTDLVAVVFVELAEEGRRRGLVQHVAQGRELGHQRGEVGFAHQMAVAVCEGEGAVGAG